MTPSLGKLERVDLRDVWRTEAQDFTPWLAREDNLAILDETLNMDLELISTEKRVGDFSADITCTNTDDGSDVLIENQLERTDHTHLGQLLTYAASLHAVSVIWIAAKFKDEHRAAMDWLNEITDPKFRFFGLEVELWRIGESLAAPKFNIVSKPNDWTRSVNQATRKASEGELTDTKALQLKFWESFRTFLIERESSVRPQQASAQHWMNFGIRKSGFLLSAISNSRDNRIGVSLDIMKEEDKIIFNSLYSDQIEIERKIGESLEWRESPGKKTSRILLHQNRLTLDQADWSDQQLWLAEKLELFKEVFGPLIKPPKP